MLHQILKVRTTLLALTAAVNLVPLCLAQTPTQTKPNTAKPAVPAKAAPARPAPTQTAARPVTASTQVKPANPVLPATRGTRRCSDHHCN